ncbi:MAG: ATP-binding protein [Alistipes sp.]|nr:ATP-binding protein [Alistipes sp.]
MFKRVQLKFFGIITAILIAIFIAVLSSVNIIMDLLMERQTKVVLQQVAAGVEYDDKTATFTFTDPGRHKTDVPPPKDKPDEEKNSAAEPGTEQTSSEPETVVVTTSADEKTKPTEAMPTQPVTAGEKPSEAEESPTEKETEAPPPTEGQKPEPEQPSEILPTEGQNPEQPPDMPDDPWQGGWGNHGGWGDKPWNEVEPPHHIWGQDGESAWQNRGEEKPVATYPPVEPQLFSSFVTVSRLSSDPPAERREKMDKFPKSMGSIDFFVIMANDKGEYVSSLNNDDLTADTAQEYIDSVLDRGKTSGMVGNMSYCAEKKSNGSLLVLTDRTAEMNMMNKLKRTTVLVGLVSLVILSAAAYFVSGLIVRPLKETFEKQKQFISDASHELKTPLTVISANADVLSGEVGDNKWLNYIRDQASRMNVLVNDLLSLTRLENRTRDFIRTDFDLSAAVTNAALPFECQAFENRRNFVLNVEEGIMVNGSEQHIKQLAAIFIDNAIKYSKEGGTVRVSLGREDGKTVLSVYNTGSGVKESEKDKLFERFYRSDESRNRSTGGYGLGLAIARSIIDKHKFKVVVENDEGRSICFKVII